MERSRRIPHECRTEPHNTHAPGVRTGHGFALLEQTPPQHPSTRIVHKSPHRTLIAEAGEIFAFAPDRTDATHGGAAADGAVLAPIPGKVTAIPIAVGQRVAKGETLIVLEAMKMEYTLSAPFDGTVAAINASSGEQVTEGTVLVEIAEKINEWRYFDDWSIGDTIAHPIRRTVTEADNLLITTLTHNPQPLHLDAEYAKGTEFGRIVVNGTFTFSLMVGISVAETTLGTLIANLGYDAVRMPKPVFIGDTLRIESEVIDLRASGSRPEAGIVTFAHRAINQHDEIVCTCTRTALIRRRPK